MEITKNGNYEKWKLQKLKMAKNENCKIWKYLKNENIPKMNQN